MCPRLSPHFLFKATPPTKIYTLSLHDALPIYHWFAGAPTKAPPQPGFPATDKPNPSAEYIATDDAMDLARDRKSTRLNSSHRTISYAVFCLKKKKNS